MSLWVRDEVTGAKGQREAVVGTGHGVKESTSNRNALPQRYLLKSRNNLLFVLQGFLLITRRKIHDYR